MIGHGAEAGVGERIAVPGGRVWSELLNPGAAGVPVVVVHGGPGTPHDYLRPVADLLPAHPVLVYDQLGCGRSDRPDDPELWRLPRFVDELAEVVRAHRFDRFHLYAHSFGTMIACDLALRGEPGLASLVLHSPVLSVRRHEREMQDLLMRMPPRVSSAISAVVRGVPGGAEQADAMLHFAERYLCRRLPWPDVLAHGSAAASTTVRDAMWGPTEFQVSGNLRSYHRSDRLSELGIPVLLTCGEHDFTSPKVCRAHSRGFSDARVTVIPNASHMAHLEEPEECARQWGEFFENVVNAVPS
ncbi:proline iminopeptidase-family hydrolase [Saccharopolyspora sp. NPDC002578]